MSRASRTPCVAACAALALLLTGCPYESKEALVPLESAALDARLTGAWRCLQGSEEKTARITFTPFDARQYVVSYQSPGEEGVGLARAQAGKLGGAPFLSVQSLEIKDPPAEPSWSLLRYTLIEGDLLRLRFVEDEPLKPAKDAAAARALVAKQPDAAELYSDFTVCVRLPKP